MSPVSLCDISVWIDRVDSTPQDVISISPLSSPSRVHYDKENPRQTPRPSKRQRDITGVPQLPLDSPRLFPSPSPTKSNTTPSEASIESHQSGRLSPSKQLQALEDEDQPVFFCNFGDIEEHEQRVDVAAMRDAIQRLADGVGILGYENIHIITASLSLTLDRRRFGYSWANDCTQRLTYGAMPSIACLEDIVRAGLNNDRGTGTSEDDWNTNVQHPLIKLALDTCKHKATLNIHGVKTLTIDPKSLARTKEGMPRRIIDYVVALKSDEITKQAWHALEPLSIDGRKTIKSWNHVTRNRNLRTEPIAVNVETKGPHKSWTDGKPQIAIWTDAWLNRLTLLPRAKDRTEPWPAIPLLIAQGHDWHLLVISRDGEKTVIRDKIDVGSTRSCFDAMKVVAVLHWCMNWAETVWRPWFLSLI
ncbi:hypothetical protein BDU57DRAFT_536750 [Ampelomyces quisqualis]|uniref:PD-(D/E)XK nuclease-like domain-containing protein n=1 Tax=Ampelomyces quisqualis TaxID=50730 RepID=A0A6A5QYZ9_AMPQU|nr:hypothetical protein BDU57DRAFT_536750 [Ampelomyces quisqualis]